jgi:DNA-binding transcriptional ArsR family regulator
MNICIFLRVAEVNPVVTSSVTVYCGQMKKRKPLSAELVEFAAVMLKCVGHPVRLRVVELLEARGKLPVQELQAELDIGQPVVSQHLAKMKALGLLRAERKEGMVYYSVAMPQLFKLLECIRACDPGYRQGPLRATGGA